MSVRLPTDEDGLGGRECPSGSCSPGYFKVKSGTGITGGQTQAFCPYCRHADDPNGFNTQEQIRYIKDLIFRELHQSVGKMLGDALDLGPSGKKTIGGGFLSMEMSYKQGSPPHVHRPFEEELRRDLVCPHCTLVHAVFGLATWCPDCGKDIFIVHVGKEFEVIRAMLGDVDRRRRELGARVGARDIENALEDTVSIFEAVLRALIRRHLKEAGNPDDRVEEIMAKKVGNRFQNVELATLLIRDLAGVELFEGFDQGIRDGLKLTFEKRHPITHNLGVIDRKYLDKARHGGLEGREIRVSVSEVDDAIGHAVKVLAHLHERLFPVSGKDASSNAVANPAADNRSDCASGSNAGSQLT